MTHFLMIIIFACLASVVFGVIVTGKETVKDKALYSLRMFIEFVGVALVLSWLFYIFF